MGFAGHWSAAVQVLTQQTAAPLLCEQFESLEQMAPSGCVPEAPVPAVPAVLGAPPAASPAAEEPAWLSEPAVSFEPPVLSEAPVPFEPPVLVEPPVPLELLLVPPVPLEPPLAPTLMKGIPP
jgi:hypothetical protein